MDAILSELEKQRSALDELSAETKYSVYFDGTEALYLGLPSPHHRGNQSNNETRKQLQ
jgi:hypothetical protein